MKSRSAKPRSRRQRLFFNFLEKNASRFRIPLVIDKRTDEDIQFSFQEIPRNLHGVLSLDRVYSGYIEGNRRHHRQRHSHGEIMILADWQDETWDIIADFEAFPRKVANGYVCSDCLPEYREVFQTREALWRNHLFDPLLEWINEELAPASALGLYQTRMGSTWAKLLRAGDDRDSDRLVAKIALPRSQFNSRT